GDHAADRGEVVEGRELLAGGGAAAGREDRVGHLEAAEAGADVDTSRAFEGIVVVTEDDLAHLREPAASRSGVFACASAPSMLSAPTASAGTVPRASHRTRSPANTGPSTQD